jgi:hypothetical protein
MGDVFTETTRVSWFTRIKNSVVGVLIGLILIVVMVFMLFWNEGRAVQTARSLTEGAGAVVSVSPDAVDAANEGRLIHVAGPVSTTSRPSDPTFGIAVDGVRLVRTVEMYQWKESSKSETTTKVGGGQETVTTYSYAKEWSEAAIDSSSFKTPDGHSNPSMEIRSERFQVPDAKLGAFTLSERVISGLGGEKKLTLSTDMTETIDAAYSGNKRVTVAENRIYLGFNSTNPAIGDYRISYEVAPLGVASVIGAQRGGGFEPYQTVAGDQLLMVADGAVPADKMFADAQSANMVLTWVLRVVGLVLLAIGFSMLLAPLGVVADVIPPLGSLLRMGTGIVGMLLAVVVGFVTIAVAWFWYRPVLSLIIIAIGVAIAAALIFIGRSRASKAPAAAQAA